VGEASKLFSLNVRRFPRDGLSAKYVELLTRLKQSSTTTFE
jgi:hypothetical protein